MGQVIDFETKVDRPCDTEAPCETVGMSHNERILERMQGLPANSDGYKSKHFEDGAEPTSSNPFPWWRIHHQNGRCWFRWQSDNQTFVDKEIGVGEALRAIADLALFVRLKGLK